MDTNKKSCTLAFLLGTSYFAYILFFGYVKFKKIVQVAS